MRSRPALSVAALAVGFGTLMAANWAQAVLSERDVAMAIVSESLWRSIAMRFGRVAGSRAEVSLLPILGLLATISAAAWLVGAAIIARRQRLAWKQALAAWGLAGWLWSGLPCLWIVLFTVLGPESLLVGTLPLWLGLALAGWTTTFISMASGWKLDRPAPLPMRPVLDDRRVPLAVWGAMAVYVATFGALTTMLWVSLQVPHGDSAMYEEHLWNLLHGKGFRSYLDGGRLFLGEHVQVVHILLVPLYVLWPFHLLLEFCQSAALAAGAVPLFWMVRRHTGLPLAGKLAATAYLLYFPMQFLDIAVDFKTFRPNAFEIPFLLFGLDALERGRRGQFLVWTALTLSCQEDAAPILAPLGIWIALRQSHWESASRLSTPQISNLKSKIHNRLFGLLLALFATIYLVLVLKVVLPWFRGGGDVHFASYYSDLGASSGEIVQNFFRDPGRFAARIWTGQSLVFGLALLLPLGGLSLLSPGRLCVTLPMFGVLSLSDITNDPRHHFHAPLVPILLWASAAGLGRVAPRWNAILQWWCRRKDGKDPFSHYLRFRVKRTGKVLNRGPARSTTIWGSSAPPRARAAGDIVVACWALFSAFWLGAFIGLTPLSLAFWDPGSLHHWRSYAPDARAQRFPDALALVPPTARVASTDFVHPRFTHHDRSYDYSGYRPNVPADAEYIVIDTSHRYSTIRRPQQIPEFRDHPDRWDVLMEGPFIVLRRR